IRPLAGKPLLVYSIEAARASLLLESVFVSTDDEEIAQVAETLNCGVIQRPADLAADHTPTLPVIVHALETLQARALVYDYVVLLQPTAPFRSGDDIDNCLRLLRETGADSVISVVCVPGHFHPNWQFTVTQGKLQ